MNRIKYIFQPIRSDNGWFEENRCFWNENLGAYVCRYTVWRISDTETAYCEVKIDPVSNRTNIDVYTAPKTYYGPYYYALWHPEERTEEFETIQRRINDLLARLHVEEEGGENV